MQIGQLARQGGVPIDTVRYYERCGLLAAPARRSSGYRDYSTADLERLKFIRRGKHLGFSLQEVHELLSLAGNADADRGDVRSLVARRLAEVERQQAELERVRETLASLAASCTGHGPVAGCPIIARVLEAPLGTESGDPAAGARNRRSRTAKSP